MYIQSTVNWHWQFFSAPCCAVHGFDPRGAPSSSQHTWPGQLTPRWWKHGSSSGKRSHGASSAGPGGPAVPAGGVQRGDQPGQRHRVAERQQPVHGQRDPEQRLRVAEPELRRRGQRRPGEPEPPRSRGARGDPPARPGAGRRGAGTHRPQLLLLHQGLRWRGGRCCSQTDTDTHTHTQHTPGSVRDNMSTRASVLPLCFWCTY